MAKYLISFPAAAMVVPAGELEAVGLDARAVIEEAKASGVYVFAGGIEESVPPTLVGGFAVLELPSREEAVGLRGWRGLAGVLRSCGYLGRNRLLNGAFEASEGRLWHSVKN